MGEKKIDVIAIDGPADSGKSITVRLKIFLVASLEENAKRKQGDFYREGEPFDLKKVIRELKKRDLIDSTRAIGPLKKADDTIELDMTNLTIEQHGDFVIDQWNKIVKFNC